jgi:hypothetical protein
MGTREQLASPTYLRFPLPLEEVNWGHEVGERKYGGKIWEGWGNFIAKIGPKPETSNICTVYCITFIGTRKSFKIIYFYCTIKVYLKFWILKSFWL